MPHVLFSAGGKEAIFAWRLEGASDAARASLEAHGGGDGMAGGIRPGLLCTHVAPERNSTASKRGGDRVTRSELEADSRYLSLAATALRLPQRGASETGARTDGAFRVVHVLAASTSQSQVDIFILPDAEPATLLPVGRLTCHAGPMLCMQLEVVPDGPTTSGLDVGAAVLVLGGSTAGMLTVWDLRPLVSKWLASEGGGECVAPRKEASAGPPCVDHWLAACCQVQAHAMGINSLCILHRPDLHTPQAGASGAVAERPAGTLLIGTGGDDQAVGVIELHLNWLEGAAASSTERRILSVTPTTPSLRNSVHSAGVRGVAAVGGDFLLSVGADSRLRAWRACPAVDGGYVLENCWSLIIGIEQVHGLCVHERRTPDDALTQVEIEIEIVVVGFGIEVFPSRLTRAAAGGAGQLDRPQMPEYQ